MIQKKCTNSICRRQQPDILLGFWKDITTQEFCIKSNGRVVKKFMGKVFVPRPITLSEMNIEAETFGGLRINNPEAKRRLADYWRSQV